MTPVFPDMWSMTLVRAAAGAHPLAAVAAACTASCALGERTTFRYLVKNGQTLDFEPTRENLQAHLAQAAGGDRIVEMVGGVTLSAEGTDPAVLSYRRDPLAPGGVEDLLLLSVTAGTFDPPFLWQWLGDLARAFGSAVAYLETYAAARFNDEGRRRAREAAEEPDMRQFLPPPNRLVRENRALADRFARALPVNYHRSERPHCVNWANVWADPVIDRLGRARVEQAPWHRRKPLAGGLLLVASPDPPDADHPQALEALVTLAESLDLAGDEAPP